MKGIHIALDFDRTLAFYHGGKNGISTVGAPVPKILNRLKVWLDKDYKVSIFTARVAPAGKAGLRSEAFIKNQTRMIWDFLERNGIPKLPVTAIKYPHFTHFFDDKAIKVDENDGECLPDFIVFYES